MPITNLGPSFKTELLAENYGSLPTGDNSSIGSNLVTWSDNSMVTSGLALYADAGVPDSYIGSGTTWKDLSTNTNNGTLTGPTFNMRTGGNFLLDGTDDSVNFGNSSTLNSTTEATIEIWVKLASDFPKGNFDALIGKTSGSIANYYIGANKGDGKLMHYYTPNNTADTFRILNVNLSSYPLNVWCQIATVFRLNSGNSGNTDILSYLNGSLLSSQLNNSGNISTTTANLQVGVGSFSVAIARIYTTALTANQVLQNFYVFRNRFIR